MNSRDFVIWLKGFTEACNEYTPTPKQWDRIKEVLGEVEYYSDDANLEFDPEDWYGALEEPNTPLTGSISQGSSTTSTTWMDKNGAWHYTNSQEKKQLLD